MSTYLDSSVVVPLFVPQSQQDAVIEWLGRARIDGTVSEFTLVECASAFSRLVRETALSEAAAREALGAVVSWSGSLGAPVRFVSSDFDTARMLVSNAASGLRGPDALHLAAARRLKLRLATLDRKLANAARALSLPVEDGSTILGRTH
jgi:predicted nucleic acid-binding protein